MALATWGGGGNQALRITFFNDAGRSIRFGMEVNKYLSLKIRTTYRNGRTTYRSGNGGKIDPIIF